MEVAPDPDGQPLAFVFKTVADQFVGHISLFKVLSGTMRADDHLVNSRSGTDERLHGLFTVRGHEQEPANVVVAGDIARRGRSCRAPSPATPSPRRARR